MSISLKRTLMVVGIGVFFCVGSIRAQEASFEGEAIRSFDTRVEVETDGSILVTETIEYQTAPAEQKHGIYRDIRTESSQGKEMSIERIEVLDKNGRDFPFEKSKQSKDIRLKIGDPNTTFSGEKTYIIKYRVTHAVGYFDNFDEIYWNTTGNNWPFPILSATAEVLLPEGSTMKQGSCYEGPTGSQELCRQDVNQFASKRTLSPGEGMTVAVGFDKGIVIEKFSLRERMMQFFEAMSLFLGIGIFVWTSWSSYRRWYQYGRDPKERAVIVREYDVPDKLTPLEVSGILSEAQIDQKAYIAQIVSLATRGYIRIHQDQEKHVFGLITTNDYELERLPKNDNLKRFDELFLEGIFNGEEKVRLSSLKNIFYKKIPAIGEAVKKSLKDEGYYVRMRELKGNTGMPSYTLLSLSALFLVVGGILFKSMSIAVGSLLAAGVWFFFMFISPQKTEKGISTKEHIEGLKLYIEKAEKARMEFHDAPEKTPELFSSLLPYAMVLGVVEIWFKEFENLHYANPDWYVATGANHTMISGNFFQDFDGFSSALTSSTSAPGSSGSGSSGGGGGGGGGGSW